MASVTWSRRKRGWHHHGSDTPTSPRAVLHHKDTILCTFMHTTVITQRSGTDYCWLYCGCDILHIKSYQSENQFWQSWYSLIAYNNTAIELKFLFKICGLKCQFYVLHYFMAHMQNVPLQTPKQKNAEIVFFHSLYQLTQKKSTLTAQIF